MWHKQHAHNAHATAEIAIGLLLAASRRIHTADSQMRAGKWLGRGAPSAPELGGMLQSDYGTVLVMGYGNIGKRVAAVCKALGMRVMATCRHPEQATRMEGVEIHSNAELHSLLPQCTAVVVALPLTNETRGMVGKEELALMMASPDANAQKRCCLVNVGRADIVDEEALWHALQVDNGTRFAYGADVWWSEPGLNQGMPTSASTGESEANSLPRPSERFPFHRLENVCMTPHYAGGKGLNGVEQARVDALLKVVDAVADAKPLKAVDVRAGY